MTKLKDLINSLASVIVRYHDSQDVPKKLIVENKHALLRKKSRQYAIDTMQNTEMRFDQKFEQLIDTCTKKYPDRQPFLNFILKEIVFLNAQLDKKVPYASAELNKLQQQISQLFIDIRQLLNIYKNIKYEVAYSSLEDKPIVYEKLNGLINDAYIGNHFCNSGDLLLEEVLNRFSIAIDDSDEEINEVAASLCFEHQNALLVTQHMQLESQQSTLALENSVLTGEKESLTLQKSELEEQKTILEQQVEQLQKDKSLLAHQKSSLEADNASLTLQKLKLVETTKGQEEMIEKLRHDLEQSQIDLQKTRLELDSNTKQKSEQPKRPPIFPLYGGISPFYLLNQQKGTFFQSQGTTESKIEITEEGKMTKSPSNMD